MYIYHDWKLETPTLCITNSIFACVAGVVWVASLTSESDDLTS